MNSWRRKLDQVVMLLGGVVANGGVFAQFAGFALAFLFDNPISGYAWIERGFWIAGLGGAGLIYGFQVDADGTVAYPGGPCTYNPPARRWPAALWSLIGVPVWGVLSLPLGIVFYGVLLVGGSAMGCLWLIRVVRRAG